MILHDANEATRFDDVDPQRDRHLVERCQEGDATAFDELYSRYRDRLYRFCLRRLRDPHEAEDTTQEAFARAWRALPRFAGERRFYPWLSVIAANLCTDTVRRRARAVPIADMDLAMRQHSSAVAVESSEDLALAGAESEIAVAALGRLSERHRHVLAMREGSGWSYQRIADHEGVGVTTIETLLWRARQALRREYSELSRTKGAIGIALVAISRVLRKLSWRTRTMAPVASAGPANPLRAAAVSLVVVAGAVSAAGFGAGGPAAVGISRTPTAGGVARAHGRPAPNAPTPGARGGTRAAGGARSPVTATTTAPSPGAAPAGATAAMGAVGAPLPVDIQHAAAGATDTVDAAGTTLNTAGGIVGTVGPTLNSVGAVVNGTGQSSGGTGSGPSGTGSLLNGFGSATSGVEGVLSTAGTTVTAVGGIVAPTGT